MPTLKERWANGLASGTYLYQLKAGVYGFRLRQVDFDGVSQYSSEVEVYVPVPGTVALTQPWPNPTTGAAQLDLVVATSQHVTVSIYDALGRRARVLLDRSVTSGSRVPIQLDTASLPGGAYSSRARRTIRSDPISHDRSIALFQHFVRVAPVVT